MAILVNFAVLLPLFILLRADAEAGWPWPVVLIPVWLGDLLFGAAVVWRLVAAFKQHSASAGAGGGHLHLTLSHSLLAALVYLLLLTSQILLAMRLEGTKAEHAVSFSVALLPFYVALLPNAATALVSLLTACYRRVRHSSGDSSEQPPPPTLNQLLPSAYALAGRLLLAASLCLAALEGDGVLDISWWLVLLPMWVQVGLLVAQWHAMLKGALGAQGMAEEERAAKIGASVLLGVVGLLGGACFLLLSLKVGGQADYAAWVIASPLFGALALACCCLSCLACIANAAAAAQRNYSNGHPPYDQVGPDEESAAQSMEAEAASDGGGGGSSGGGSSSGGSSSSVGRSSSGRGRDGTSTSAACDSAPPSSASDTAAAMEEGAACAAHGRLGRLRRPAHDRARSQDSALRGWRRARRQRERGCGAPGGLCTMRDAVRRLGGPTPRLSVREGGPAAADSGWEAIKAAAKPRRRRRRREAEEQKKRRLLRSGGASSKG